MSYVRSLAVISALVASAGCYAYRVAPLTAIGPKDQVRVTAADGQRFTAQEVTITADTLRGITIGESFLRTRRDRLSIPVAGLTPSDPGENPDPGEPGGGDSSPVESTRLTYADPSTVSLQILRRDGVLFISHGVRPSRETSCW